MKTNAHLGGGTFVDGHMNPTVQNWWDTYKYAIPVIGSWAYGYDRAKDYSQMQRDYNKNVGKAIKYVTNAYSSLGMHQYGRTATDILGTAGGIGRTVRSLI